MLEELDEDDLDVALVDDDDDDADDAAEGDVVEER